ncbi:hypothetical protein ACFLZM_00250 [Thermodesulfobacteriota bacterium]
MALNKIADELAKAGEIKQANHVLADALDAAKTIKDAYMRGVSLSNIARDLAKAGNIEQAIDAAKNIMNMAFPK